MIIFCFLGVGPPCCSILCQFWLCEEAQCVYLRRHLGSLVVPEDLDSKDGNEELASKATEAPEKGCSGQVCGAFKEKKVLPFEWNLKNMGQYGNR